MAAFRVVVGQAATRPALAHPTPQAAPGPPSTRRPRPTPSPPGRLRPARPLPGPGGAGPGGHG